MRGLATALTVSLVIPLSTLSAQQPPQIAVGERIRFTAPSCGIRREVATVEALRGDTLIIETSECPLAHVTWIEVSRMRTVNPIKVLAYPSAGLVSGFAFGVLGGFLLVDFLCPPCSSDSESIGSGTGAAIFGSLGFVSGLVAGLQPRDKWEEVPLDRLRVNFVPQRDGRFSLGLSVTF